MLLMGKSTISMAIFNSYVSLPEGNHENFYALKRLHGVCMTQGEMKKLRTAGTLSRLAER